MTQGPPPDPIASPAFELPTARAVVTFGLSLAYRTSGELQRASIYLGLLTLALLGPPVVFLVEFIAHFRLLDDGVFASYFAGGLPGPVIVQSLLLLYAVGLVGFLGWYPAAIDGQLIAVSLLAAKETDRSYSLRDATIRARQVFWRMIRGTLLRGLAGFLVNLVVGAILGALFPSAGEASSVIVSVVGVLVLAPFGYLATGIILGDVGAVEALKRSVGLARARPRVAIVVALFTLITAAIQLFGLAAGLDLFGRVAEFVHLGLEGGAVALAMTILGILLLVTAFGSLTLTVGAIVSAPQVAAFLGLTFYSAGLDRARDVPAGAPRFRWVTRPMLACIVICALGSAYGIAGLGSGR
jgi:hypothetical protein